MLLGPEVPVTWVEISIPWGDLCSSLGLCFPQGSRMYLPDKNSYNYIFMDGEKHESNTTLYIAAGAISHEVEGNWHTTKKKGTAFPSMEVPSGNDCDLKG